MDSNGQKLGPEAEDEQLISIGSSSKKARKSDPSGIHSFIQAKPTSGTSLDKYVPNMKVSHDNLDYFVSKYGKGNLEKMATNGFSPDSLADAECTNCHLPMDWKARGRIQPVKDKKGKFVRWRYASYDAGDCLSKGVNYNPDNKHNAIEVTFPKHIISPPFPTNIPIEIDGFVGFSGQDFLTPILFLKYR